MNDMKREVLRKKYENAVKALEITRWNRMMSESVMDNTGAAWRRTDGFIRVEEKRKSELAAARDEYLASLE